MNKIDTTSWKKFKIRDLFVINKGQGSLIKIWIKKTTINS